MTAIEKIEKAGININSVQDLNLKDKDLKTLLEPNRFKRTLSEYFQNKIISKSEASKPYEQFEFYLLFMR